MLRLSQHNTQELDSEFVGFPNACFESFLHVVDTLYTRTGVQNIYGTKQWCLES